MNIKEQYKGLRAELLGRDPFLMKLFVKAFFKPKENTLGKTFDDLGKSQKVYFVQIGGNDGFANDPIFRMVKKHGWKGIILEPQKNVFTDRLSRTYRNEKNVKLINAAITKESGEMPLYKLAFSESRWATGLATFEKSVMIDRIKNNDRIKRRAIAEGVDLPEDINDWIAEEAVKCYSLADLCQKEEINQIDLLQIDTEGFDYQIIKSIDFDKCDIQKIAFERHLLSEEDQIECKSLLEKNGYQVQDLGGDSFASKMS